MGEQTKIEWCDHTFNPWRGCVKVAAGCANCYAESQAKRAPNTLGKWGPNGTRVIAAESAWKQVEKWNRMARGVPPHGWPTPDGTASVFCGSMCDVFEDWPGEIRDSSGKIVHQCRAGHHVSLDAVYVHGAECESGCNRAAHPLTMSDVRNRVFNRIDATNLTWLLLTKRPENIRRMIPIASNGRDAGDPQYMSRDNLWLGTSIACQEDAERNIPELLKCRDLCAGLFLSIEPLIGPVDVREWLHDSDCHYRHGVCHCSDPRESHIDQVIIGGESGPNARPCNVDWIRSIARQCESAGVPCFVKQLGSVPVVDGASRGAYREQDNLRTLGVVRDKKGGDPAEWPEDLRQYRSLAWKGGE